MLKITKYIILSFLIIFTLLAPSLSFAVEVDQAFKDGKSIVPCGSEKTELKNEVDPETQKETQTGGDVVNKCEFDHILILINKIVNFLLFTLAIPIAAVMFCYAGFLMIFSGGEASARTKAKGIFWNVVFGLVIAVAAWVIIHTLLGIVGAKTGDGWNWFGLKN